LKLLRFLLQDEPTIRTGVFHDGRVYETDGQNALGVHSPNAIHLLAPMAHAPTLRVFDAFSDDAIPPFEFRNAAAVFGAESDIVFPDDAETMDFEVNIAAVVSTGERDLDVLEASDYLLGYTAMLQWVADGTSRKGAKARDFGVSLGPFVVTPDELGDSAFVFKAAASVNGEAAFSADTSSARFSFAELIQEASRGTRIHEGEIIATGCLPGASLRLAGKPLLERGDEVSVTVESIGTLTNRVA
jgi:2-keto-4-pentenoate hydratase/2-oxohepta-3-ene-1,7-dioic acid hydratase in catechol pathway